MCSGIEEIRTNAFRERNKKNKKIYIQNPNWVLVGRMENKPYHDPNLSGLGFTLLAISLHRNPVDIMNPLTRQCLRISKRANGVSVAQRALYSTQETFGLQNLHRKRASELLTETIQFDKEQGPDIFTKIYRKQNERTLSANSSKRNSNNHIDSNVLYWPCGTLNFYKSDFDRIMPSPLAQITHDQPVDYDQLKFHSDLLGFRVVRLRDPVTLKKHSGYHLVFKTAEAAQRYKAETIGAQINGLKVRLESVPTEDANKVNKYLKNRVQLTGFIDVIPRMCVVMKNLPSTTKRYEVNKLAWNFGLIGNDSKAITQLETSEGQPTSWLVRFHDTVEPRLFKRKFDGHNWPGSDHKIEIEILD